MTKTSSKLRKPSKSAVVRCRCLYRNCEAEGHTASAAADYIVAARILHGRHLRSVLVCSQIIEISRALPNTAHGKVHSDLHTRSRDGDALVIEGFDSDYELAFSSHIISDCKDLRTSLGRCRCTDTQSATIERLHRHIRWDELDLGNDR